MANDSFRRIRRWHYLEARASRLHHPCVNHINETLQTLIPKLFNDITLAGFDVVPEEDEEDTENLKDSAMIVESIRSLLCKYYEIKHPIQEISNSFFIEQKDGTVTVASKLDINLENYEEEPADLG